MGMTNQEAIKRIEEHIAIHKYRESHAMHIVEALDQAISALQAQDVPDTNVGKIKCEDAVHKITSASFTGNDGLDYVETLVALNALKMVKKPCDDAVNREDVLEVNRRHHGEMPNEVNYQMWKELKALPTVTPKLLNIDFLMSESELVFYDNDHGFCINTQDVLEHIRDICND